MRRRSFLAACCALGVGGCVAPSSPGSSAAEFDAEASVETEIEPVDADDAADIDDADPLIAVTGEVLDQPSAETPLRIELVVENVSSETLEIPGPAGFAPFEANPASDGADELFLMPGPGHSSSEELPFDFSDQFPDDPVDGCWRPDDPGPLYWIFPDLSIVRPVVPGETVRREYAVIHRVDDDAEPPEGGDCYPAGEHEYVDEITPHESTDEWTAYQWTTRLSIERR